MTTPQPADGPPPTRQWRAHDLTLEDLRWVLDLFISKFEPGAPHECWVWQGKRAAIGYGLMYYKKNVHLYAHRISWVAFTGQPLTGNITIDHLCLNKACINPNHLEPVTIGENVRRCRRYYSRASRLARGEAA